MKTVLLSALTRQFLVQGARFAELHPNDWLMWSAGTMNVPRGNIATAETVVVSLDETAQRPRVDDPLCFVLERRVDGTTVTIGRAEGNDIVLSDEAVSRNHCTLVFAAGGWRATCPEERTHLMLDGKPLHFGQWLHVSSGQTLGIGHLSLTLYTTQGMALRLASKLARLSK